MSKSDKEVLDLIREKFISAGINIVSADVKAFPGERIVIVEVSDNFEEAVRVANSADLEINDGFVTVRKAAVPTDNLATKPMSIQDQRYTSLIEMLTARSQTSEAYPSLSYVQDAAQRVKLALSQRHHLVFGRRGVGKTALLLEAKRQAESTANETVWINMHSLRGQSAERAFLSVIAKLCLLPEQRFTGWAKTPRSVTLGKELSEKVTSMLGKKKISTEDIGAIIPQVQHLLQVFGAERQADTFIFLDDIHYLPMQIVPYFLDYLRSATRDVPVWLKVAGIKHQTRWFIASPPTGLQTGHDAAIIDLDITLEEPGKAKNFLSQILQSYVAKCSLPNLSSFLSPPTLDRLVLASGGVPRDFLTLCASAIEIARQRANARLVGVQDVNNAAGLTAKVKLQELEGDATASLGTSQSVLSALQKIREFLLEEKQITFLRVDFRSKEKHAEEYHLVQSLMDLRMLHILSSSLSDRDKAGRRSEVYLLDLSEYSGQRLKQNLRVLDFERDHLVLKKTRSTTQARRGDTPKKLMSILRLGPELDLNILKVESSTND